MPGSSRPPAPGTPAAGSTPDVLKPGVIVATFVEAYAEEVPQLGRVLGVTAQSIELEWLAGGYSGKKTP